MTLVVLIFLLLLCDLSHVRRRCFFRQKYRWIFFPSYHSRISLRSYFSFFLIDQTISLSDRLSSFFSFTLFFLLVCVLLVLWIVCVSVSGASGHSLSGVYFRPRIKTFISIDFKYQNNQSIFIWLKRIIFSLKAGQYSLKNRENTSLPTEIVLSVWIKREMLLKQTTIST